MAKKKTEDAALVNESAVITVEGFEKFGALTVRPRTVQDALIRIPGAIDRMLGDETDPAQAVINNATYVAIAQFAIVEPADLVERILGSTEAADIRFFYAFADEYSKWIDHRNTAAVEKKSGEVTDGSEFASSSETEDPSSQLTLDG